MAPAYERALIVGAGDGLGATLARLFAAGGLVVGLSARDFGKLSALAQEVDALVDHMENALWAAANVVAYNPSCGPDQLIQLPTQL